MISLLCCSVVTEPPNCSMRLTAANEALVTWMSILEWKLFAPKASSETPLFTFPATPERQISLMVMGLLPSMRFWSIQHCSESKLSGRIFTRIWFARFWIPSFGMAFSIPDWPPSYPGNGRALALRAFHPFLPLPAVLPFPPRPTIFLGLLCEGFRLTLVMWRYVTDLVWMKLQADRMKVVILLLYKGLVRQQIDDGCKWSNSIFGGIEILSESILFLWWIIEC